MWLAQAPARKTSGSNNSKRPRTGKQLECGDAHPTPSTAWDHKRCRSQNESGSKKDCNPGRKRLTNKLWDPAWESPGGRRDVPAKIAVPAQNTSPPGARGYCQLQGRRLTGLILGIAIQKSGPQRRPGAGARDSGKPTMPWSYRQTMRESDAMHAPIGNPGLSWLPKQHAPPARSAGLGIRRGGGDIIPAAPLKLASRQPQQCCVFLYTTTQHSAQCCVAPLLASVAPFPARFLSRGRRGPERPVLDRERMQTEVVR